MSPVTQNNTCSKALRTPGVQAPEFRFDTPITLFQSFDAMLFADRATLESSAAHKEWEMKLQFLCEEHRATQHELREAAEQPRQKQPIAGDSGPAKQRLRALSAAEKKKITDLELFVWNLEQQESTEEALGGDDRNLQGITGQGIHLHSAAHPITPFADADLAKYIRVYVDGKLESKGARTYDASVQCIRKKMTRRHAEVEGRRKLDEARAQATAKGKSQSIGWGWNKFGGYDGKTKHNSNFSDSNTSQEVEEHVDMEINCRLGKSLKTEWQERASRAAKTGGPDCVLSETDTNVVENKTPSELKLGTQASLFEYIGLHPMIDVNSSNNLSSPCPQKYTTGEGMKVSLSGEFI
eukprot:gene17492-23800_t